MTIQNQTIVAPSLLAADFLEIGKAVELLNGSVADWLHLDVMDGRFVPNISFGMPVIAAIRRATQKVCDVHLMIEEPERYAEAFRDAGADVLTVHLEACRHLHRNIQQIKGLGMKAGVALNPHTPVQQLAHVIEDVDLVLIMSVNPGFGGQSFIPQSLNKIRELRELISHRGAHALIEVDGGINLQNAGAIVEAGADVLVAGSTVFSAPNPVEMITQLRQAGR